MNSINVSISKNILLTGAGFTYNFGGLLANTMWAEIHNHLHRSNQSRLIQTIKNQFDYEELYQQIINGTIYSDAEKTAFMESVLDAYRTLDGVIRKYDPRNPTIDLNSLAKLISRMIGDQRKRAFFFTLNQDIFIERWFMRIADNKPILPGIEHKYGFTSLALEGGDLDSKYYRHVMEQKELDKYFEDQNKNNWPEMLYYIKLHGSYDWRDKKNQNIMIIGKGKSERIEVEPILKCYLELFKKALSFPESRLLIIGYGFRDPHINEVIVESIKKSKLKVFIICPQDPKDFMKNTLINAETYKDTIWEAVAGYYPYTLKEIFPFNGFPSQRYINLVNDFIGN